MNIIIKNVYLILFLLFIGGAVDAQRVVDEKPTITLNSDTATCPIGYEEVVYRTTWSYPTGAFEDSCPVYEDVVELRRGCISINKAELVQDTTVSQTTRGESSPMRIGFAHQQDVFQIDSGGQGIGNINNVNHQGDGDVNIININTGDNIMYQAGYQQADTTNQQSPQDSCGPVWQTRPYLLGTVGIYANRAQYDPPSFGFGGGVEVVRTDSCSEWFLAGRLQFVSFPNQFISENCSSCDLIQTTSLYGIQGVFQVGWTLNHKAALTATARSPALWPSEQRMVHPVPNHGVYAGISWQPAWFSLSGEIGGWDTWGVFATLRIYPFELRE